MTARHSWFHRLGGILGPLAVLALSLGMLTYVNLGEAHRLYPRIVLSRVAAQGEILQDSVEPLLRADLALEQFASFPSMATSLLESDAAVAEVRLTDAQGMAVFPPISAGQPIGDEDFKPAPNDTLKGRCCVEESATAWRLLLPLSNRFERVGQLELIVPKASIVRDIQARFTWALIVLVGLLALMAVLLVFREWRKKRWRFTLPYTASFLLQAVVSMTALGQLYSEGILRETESLTHSLGHRLETATRLGLDLTELTGVDELFHEGMRRMPDIRVLTLLSGDTVLLEQTSEDGEKWPKALLHEHNVELRSSGSGQTQLLVAGVPKSFVLRHLWRGWKNSLVLLVAAGLFSIILARALERHGRTEAQPEEQRAHLSQRVELPWFLGCFAEGLSLSFLPQHFQQLAELHGFHASAGSVLLTAAFSANVFWLLPAGRASEQGQVRRLMAGGLLLSALAWMALAIGGSWVALIAIRCICGMGQALFFAGTQSYVLRVSSEATRTRGTALLASGYYGGTISGMVIGALLSVYIERTGVFWIAGLTGLLAIGVVLIRIHEPSLSQADADLRAQPSPSLLRCLAVALRDRQMLRVLLLVGLPTRMTFAGLVMFALPLLLAAQHYAQEDIGQILMFYSLGVLASTRYLASGSGAGVSTQTILLLGLLSSSVGLGLAGLMDWSPVLEQAGLVLLIPLVPITGLLMLGLGHGLILNAAVAQATSGPEASQLGNGTVASLYRAMERLGQVAGPSVAGLLLMLGGHRSVALTWAGGGLLLFAVLFILGRKPS